jgi:hypothetical protein
MPDTMTLTIEHTSEERRLLEHLSELGMRDTATILGTGAMGEPAWPYIPLDSWLVGVNGAVEIPLPFPLKLHARFAFDTSIPSLPYWKRYEQEAACLTILGDHMPALCDYRFRTGFGYEPDALNSLATVAGAALDMLMRCYLEYGKPSTVYLCGLDFGYGYYFKRGPCPDCKGAKTFPAFGIRPDGSTGEFQIPCETCGGRGEGERLRCNTPDTWGQKPHMDTMIAKCQQAGMKVYTLSKTELEVPDAPN